MKKRIMREEAVQKAIPKKRRVEGVVMYCNSTQAQFSKGEGEGKGVTVQVIKSSFQGQAFDSP